MGKRGEGSSQRTRTNDPWTWTKVWGLTVGVGVGGMEEGKGGKIGTTVNRINKNKIRTFILKTLLSRQIFLAKKK